MLSSLQESESSVSTSIATLSYSAHKLVTKTLQLAKSLLVVSKKSFLDLLVATLKTLSSLVLVAQLQVRKQVVKRLKKLTAQLSQAEAMHASQT